MTEDVSVNGSGVTGVTGGPQPQPEPHSTERPDGFPRRVLRILGWGPAQLKSAPARWTVNILALAGAVLIILSAIIHLRLWAQGYSSISVIGPLFLAQGVVSIPFAVAIGVFRRLGLLHHRSLHEVGLLQLRFLALDIRNRMRLLLVALQLFRVGELLFAYIAPHHIASCTRFEAPKPRGPGASPLKRLRMATY